MDPLSVTASAIGIITFAIQAVQVLNNDIQNIKNAPATLREATSDLTALDSMLSALREATEHDQHRLSQNSRVLLAAENCSDVCTAFQQQLKTWSKSGGDGRLTAMGRVKLGLLGQDRIKDFRTRLGDSKATLTLVLVAEQFIHAPQDESLSSMVERSEQRLSEQLANLSQRMQQLQIHSFQDEGLRSMVQGNHEQTRKQLAEISANMAHSEPSSPVVGVSKREVEELIRQLNSVHVLKEEISRIAAAIPKTVPSNEQVAKLGDHLLLTKPDKDRENLVETSGTPVTTTCQWLVVNDLFRTWLKADPAFVWLRGGTGKGKTMLSVYLTAELPTYISGPNVHVIYYFCNRQDEKRNTSAALLRSLLWQLTQRPELSDCVAKHLAEHGIPLMSEHEALWKLFAALMLDNDCGKVYCVIDALDELEDDTQLWLANKLLTLFAPGAREPHLNVLRLFLVSRPINGFKLRGQSAALDLDGDLQKDIDADIARVVDLRLATVPDWNGFSDEYKDKVRQEILRRAKGSFVPIAIIMNAILVDRPYSGLLETIQSLPQGLEALYGTTLLSIESKQQCDSPEVLRWVAMAFQPLSLQQLANAVEGDLDDTAIRATVQRCGALLKVHEDTVIFSHSSVREFLLRTDNEAIATPDYFTPEQKAIVSRFRIDPQEAHLEIALKCLQLIKDSHLQHRALDSKKDWQGVPLLQYAVLYWPHHARGSGMVGKRIFEATSFVLSKAPKLQQNWWRTYVRERPGQTWEQGEKLSPLHIACRFGITEWVKTLLAETDAKSVKKIVNECDVNGLTPLAWAAIGGHDAVVEVLLDHGADVEAQTTLYAREGITWMPSDTVKSYIREVQVGDGMWTGRHTPLYRACYKGHPAVVKLLLDRGANVHGHGWARSSPMHAVCIGGNIDVMRLLLEYGGDEDVNAEIKNSHTVPLHHAVENGHRELVEILLDHGADIQKKQRYSSASVLHFAAVKTPDPATVELLLNRGADVQVRDNHSRKPLHCFAMKHSNPEAAKLLLDNGATVNSLNGLGRTALDLAIECMCDRCQATTQMLLVYGAGLKSPTDKGRANHPELFQDGKKRESIAQMPTVGSGSSVISGDRRDSNSLLQVPSNLDEASSTTDTRSVGQSERQTTSETEATSNSARDAGSPEMINDTEGARLVEVDSRTRKRDMFRTKFGGLGRRERDS